MTSPTSPTDRPSTKTIAGLEWLGAPRRAVFRELNRLTVFDDQDVAGRDAQLGGNAAVLDEHPELAVDGMKYLGRVRLIMSFCSSWLACPIRARACRS